MGIITNYKEWQYKRKAIMKKKQLVNAVIKLQKVRQQNKADRADVHRLTRPFLYPGRHQGVPREYDPLELRRLALSEIVQLCIGSMQDVITDTPWHIFETDTESMKYLSRKPHKRTIKDLRRLSSKAVGKKSIQSNIDEIMELFNNPNTHGQPFSYLVSMIISDMLEVGDALWKLNFEGSAYKTGEDGNKILRTDKDGTILKGIKPVEIVAMDPLTFNKDIDDENVLNGYYYFPYAVGVGYTAQRALPVDKNEVVWFTQDPRTNRYYGFSPSEKVEKRLDLVDLTLEQERLYFAEGEVAPGILLLQNWRQEEADLAKKQWVEGVKGHPENMLMMRSDNKDSDIKFVNLSYNYSDLQFLDRQKWYYQIVAGCFKLNLFFIGLEEKETNRTTAEQANIKAIETGVSPLLHIIEHFINSQFIWRFWGPEQTFGFEPSMTDDAKMKHIEMLNSMVATGWLTPNEAREEEGWGKHEDGDTLKGVLQSEGYVLRAGVEGGIMTPDEARVRQGLSPLPGGEGSQIRVPEEAQPFERTVTGEPSSETRKWAQQAKKTKLKLNIKKQDDLGDSDIDPQRYEDLRNGVGLVYGEAIDAVIKEFLENPEFQEIFEKATKSWKKQTKAIPAGLREMVLATISETGLISNFVKQIGLSVGPQVMEAVMQEEEKFGITENRIVESDALERFTEKRIRYYDDIPDTLTDDVLDVLGKGIDEGKGINEVMEDLVEVREDFTTYGAERIARTELGRARREATQIFGEKYSDMFDKQWDATGGKAGDGRTRDAHRAMHGAVVPMDKAFQVPYGLQDKPSTGRTVSEMTPGDSEEGINCRCRLILLPKDLSKSI